MIITPCLDRLEDITIREVERKLDAINYLGVGDEMAIIKIDAYRGDPRIITEFIRGLNEQGFQMAKRDRRYTFYLQGPENKEKGDEEGDENKETTRTLMIKRQA